MMMKLEQLNHLNRLNQLGFVWNVLDFLWEEGFKHLVAYKDEFGGFLVQAKYTCDGYRLGAWVNTQRTKKGKLSPERVKRLDDLGFVWKVR